MWSTLQNVTIEDARATTTRMQREQTLKASIAVDTTLRSVCQYNTGGVFKLVYGTASCLRMHPVRAKYEQV